MGQPKIILVPITLPPLMQTNFVFVHFILALSIIFSAMDLETPYTLMGSTTLSVETNIKVLTSFSMATSTALIVPK